MSADAAAHELLRGVERGEFEIHFPKRFTRVMKLLSLLPHGWYFPSFDALPEAEMNLDALVRFYQDLSPEDLARFPEFYTADAYFKDPFNEVRGADAIQRIFAHMFGQVSEPRFHVADQWQSEQGSVLLWDFTFRMKRGQASTTDHPRGRRTCASPRRPRQLASRLLGCSRGALREAAR